MVRPSVSGILVVASFLVHGTAIGVGSPRSRHHPARPATPVHMEQIVEEYVEVPLDHFGENDDTFLNRFWVAESGYKWGGPVFIYDEGEADASMSALDTLQDSTFMFKQLVDRFGGIGIVWEHRFYGSSTPVKIDSSTPAEAFRYLTTEQSLADVKTFADQFHRLNFPDVDLTPLGTPWVFVGSSYSGARAAFMRNIYPETIYASFASSAPVEARIDMSAYWEAVYRGMEASGWGNCTKDIHAAVVYMDKIMGDAVEAADLKIKFLGRGADRQPNTVFAGAMKIMFDGWQDFGIGGSLRSFCDWLETDPTTTLTATADGWAAIKGVESVVDRWADWPVWTTMVNSYLMAACEGLVQGNETAADCNLNHRSTDPSNISWAWQYCTQWGKHTFYNIITSRCVTRRRPTDLFQSIKKCCDSPHDFIQEGNGEVATANLSLLIIIF